MPAAVGAQTFSHTTRTALWLAGIDVERCASQVTLGFGRWWRQWRLRGHMIPNRRNHRLEDRHRGMTAGRATAESTTLAASIVVADPNRDRDIVRKAHKPRIVLIIRSAGLPGDIG